MACSNIKTLFEVAKAIAPPEPPSPITTDMIGCEIDRQHSIDLAMASAWPRSSAPFPGYAPGVSIKVITGILNFSASFISLMHFLYPSGLIIPKFLLSLLSVSLPFS